MPSAVDVDVVVIGAGLSGLTAAYHLLQQRNTTTLRVIETRDRVGGRTLSQELCTAHGKAKWDLGGHWVSFTQPNIIKLLDELEMETYPQFRDGKRILYYTDGPPRVFEGDRPPVAVFRLIQFLLVFGKIERLVKTVSAEFPEESPNAKKWDSMTVEGFLRERGVLCRERARDMLRGVIPAVFSVQPEEMSFLYLLHMAATAGGFLQYMKSTIDGAQSRRVKNTAHGISHKLVEKIGADNVILGDRVLSINQRNGDSCMVETRNGLKFNAKYVIAALPPHLRSHIEFSEPSLPPQYNHLHRHYISGHFLKMIFTYPTLFWREKNFAGEAYFFGQPVVLAESSGAMSPNNSSKRTRRKKYEALEQESTFGGTPIVATYDASVPDGDLLHPALVVFVQPKTADLRSVVGDEQLRKSVLDQLVELYGEEAAEPIDFAIGDWHGLETPVNVCSPGALVNFGKLRRQPFGRVHWAGTETATQWIGYMDGAVHSGRRAANEVLERLQIEG